jgi:hypothetical protein
MSAAPRKQANPRLNTWFTLLILWLGTGLLAQDPVDSPGLIDPSDGKPGMVRILLPGIVSIPDGNEHTASLAPDGHCFFFTRDPKGGTLVMHRQGRNWGPPKPAPFQGREAIFSPDGHCLFTRDGDIWLLERESEAWLPPRRLPHPVNTGAYEYYASATRGGIIYFSRYEKKRARIYEGIRDAQGNWQVTPLPSPVNQSHADNYHPFISPRGDYLLFNSDRVGGRGGTDLYISRRDARGTWQKPINLGKQINSPLRDICPVLSPDEKILFFSRSWDKGGRWYGDIYWVEARFLLSL